MTFQIGQRRVNLRVLFTAMAVCSCAPSFANTQVRDALNTAEMNFRVANNDMGCTMVRLAISSASNPDV